MPQPIGDDRLQQRRDGMLVLICPHSKTWMARRPRTSTSAEHPGTAVVWEDECYEVVLVSETSNGTTRYLLAPWNDAHVIRHRVMYDAESEAMRMREQQTANERKRGSALIVIFSFVVGLLPAPQLEKIEHEYGVRREMLVWSSMAPLFLFGVYCVAHLPIVGLPNPASPLLKPFIPVGLYFIFECLLRARMLLSGKAIGSLPGVIVWFFVSLFRRPKRAAIERPQEFAPGVRDRRYYLNLRSEHELSSASVLPAPAKQNLEDALIMREPFLTLLSPPEQELLRERAGFQPLHWARQTAALLFIFSASGAVASWLAIAEGRGRVTLLFSAVAASALAIEQIYRFIQFEKGKPAASMLAFAGRPMMRTILARADELEQSEAAEKARIESLAEPE